MLLVGISALSNSDVCCSFDFVFVLNQIYMYMNDELQANQLIVYTCMYFQSKVKFYLSNLICEIALLC